MVIFVAAEDSKYKISLSQKKCGPALELQLKLATSKNTASDVRFGSALVEVLKQYICY